jgi:hypothetical protein
MLICARRALIILIAFAPHRPKPALVRPRAPPAYGLQPPAGTVPITKIAKSIPPILAILAIFGFRSARGPFIRNFANRDRDCRPDRQHRTPPHARLDEFCPAPHNRSPSGRAIPGTRKEKPVRNPRIGRVLLGAGLFISVALVVAGDKADKKDQADKPKPTNPAFEKLKSLAGEWITESMQEGADAKPEKKTDDKVSHVFSVISAGSTVMEHMLPGTPYEMVTMYHLDGPDLVLTHYCAAGNQPRMKAEKTDDANKIVFKFAGGSNMDPAKDGHMHDLTWTFTDPDHARAEWTYWDGGKKGEVTIFELKRKK